MHILIIEDDTDQAFLEANILTDAMDCTVSIVNSRFDLEEAQILKADLILLDYNLPDGDGSEIIKDIRQLSDVPVIIITGDEKQKTAVSTFKSGATDLIRKSPENLTKLPTIVQNIRDNYLKQKKINEIKKVKKQTDIKVDTLRQVLTTLAHYINNSTTTIYGYAQLCEHSEPDLKRCKKLADISIKETRKISFVLEELDDFVTSTEIRTTNYVNIPEAMFSIEENLKKKMEHM